MLIIFEGLLLSFWLLLICVIGISNGAVGLANFYEQDVQDRVVKSGLTTKEKIKRANAVSGAAIFLPNMLLVPAAVHFVNGAEGFLNCFLQIYAVYMIANLFDRLFIDEWWVGRTKAWIIPGTEDLMPYIPAKRKLFKWIGSIVGFALMAAAASGVLQLIG